jgi:AraC-like DNA-binding protein
MAALQNSEGQLTEREAAAMVGCSSRTFRRLIRSVFGKSFRDLRLKVKMECAKRILLDTQLSIPAISSWLGYAARSKFECSFKRQFGLTPTKYRECRTAKGERLKKWPLRGSTIPKKSVIVRRAYRSKTTRTGI